MHNNTLNTLAYKTLQTKLCLILLCAQRAKSQFPTDPISPCGFFSRQSKHYIIIIIIISSKIMYPTQPTNDNHFPSMLFVLYSHHYRYCAKDMYGKDETRVGTQSHIFFFVYLIDTSLYAAQHTYAYLLLLKI